MNLKYIKSILPVSACLLTMGLSSCVNDLDVTPIDPSTVMDVDVAALFNKCYANMALAGNGGANGDCDVDGLDGGTTGFVRQLWNANELTTDEAICCWGDEGIPAFNNNAWSASHPMLKGFYYRCYSGIDYCNKYISDPTTSNYNEKMTAEIRFLRALYYSYLLDCFGNVPYSTEVSLDAPKQLDSRADLCQTIIDEVKSVYTQLSDAQPRKSSDEGYGRVDKDAADLLLARLYLNSEVYTGTAQWQNAYDYAKKVVDGAEAGTGHPLNMTGVGSWSAYQMLFMGDNGESSAASEAILPLLQDGVTTTSWGTTLFLIASTWKDDMKINGSGAGTSETWAGNRARTQLIQKFTTSSVEGKETDDILSMANDDRALFYGKGRTQDIEDAGEFTNGISVIKFSNRYSDGGTPHDSKFVDADFFLMRSAEAYLILAEADARLNGGTTTTVGTAAIDKIRSRAHATNNVKETDGSYSLQTILDERSRELYYEGFRRTDLIRYGQFGGKSNYSWQYKGGSYAGVNFDEHLNVFAIPQDDINTNPYIQQNVGY